MIAKSVFPELLFHKIQAQSKLSFNPFRVYNPLKQKLTYLILHKPSRKVIYRLDLGQNHKNPDGTMVGEVHKHLWQIPYEDRIAYHPLDITAKVSQPIEVWDQFCKEAKIQHLGKMNPPQPYQPDIFI